MNNTRGAAFLPCSLPWAAVFVLAFASVARPEDVRKAAFTDSFDAAGAAMWQPFPSAAKVEGGVATIAPMEGQQWLASLQPEPHVATLVQGLLADRFPADGKLVYTLYNKLGAPVTGEAIIAL